MARQTPTKSKPMKKEATKHTPSGGGDIVVEPGRTRRLEALGVLMMVLAAGLFFALVSFDPADRAGTDNLVGPIGSAFARGLIGGIGVMGYVVCGLVTLVAGAVFVGKARWPRWIGVVSAVGMVFSTTILSHLVAGQGRMFGYSAGGVVGGVTAELLRSFVGPAGAGLFAVGLFLVCLLGAFEISFSVAINDTTRGARWLITYVKGSLTTWWEANALAKSREAELIAEDTERRARAAAEKLESERALREKLEEKKRLALLKASARAEEKALAKIAADEAKARVMAEAQNAANEAPKDLPKDAPAIVERKHDKAKVEAEVTEPAEIAREEIEIDAGDSSADDKVQRKAKDKKHKKKDKKHKKKKHEAVDEGDEGDEGDEASESSDVSDFSEDDWFEDGDFESEVAEDDDETAVVDDEVVEDEASDDDGPQIIEHRPEGPNVAVLNSDDCLNIEVKSSKRTYQLPPLKHLDYDAPAQVPIDPEMLRARATRLEEKLRTYGVDGRVAKIRPGPVVTTYEYQPAPGVKVAKIAGLSDDIAMSMEARSVRIIAPIPGRGVVGIELPNEKRETVYLREIIAHDCFLQSKSLLTIAMGKDAEGDARVANLAKMPHLLVAGTTGSGKSVATNAMILSILYKATPDQVKFIMVDPKMLELSLYDGIPHLLLPVVTDAKKASLALQWAVDEMERRYRLLSKFKVRSIDGFNSKLELLRAQRGEAEVETTDTPSDLPAEVEAAVGKRIPDPWRGEDLPDDMPYIVVLIDEFADLMCVAPRDVEMAVQRLAQKARASGIHLIIATQRPSTDVITGVIKNNLPTRMSFRVASRHDSATVINAPGAENLLGMGDMLYLSQTSPAPTRIHGAFVTEGEVQRVADFWKEQGKPTYDPQILQPRDDESGPIAPEDYDEMYDQAVAIVTETNKASISALQRRLRVGYNRAARMVEMMEREGIVSGATGPKGEREVLVQDHGVE